MRKTPGCIAKKSYPFFDKKEQRQFNGQRTVCSTNGAVTSGHPHAKNGI